MRIWLLACVGFLVLGPAAAASAPLPPANAGPAVVAGQFLEQISELKVKPMVVACIGIPRNVAPGITFLGGAIVKGNVMVLSLGVVCRPLQGLWRELLTHHPQPTLPFSVVDAVEIIANEWFVTQGVTSGQRALCKAVQYTWKWLRRNDLSASFLPVARAHLLDQALLPSGYVITPGCLATG